MTAARHDGPEDRAIDVRPLRPTDVEAAAEILRDAFDVIYRRRGHLPPFPTVESASWLCRAYLDLDPAGGLVAEERTEARLVGVGFIHVRGDVASVGPLAARPGAGPGVGRALMAGLCALSSGCASLRLFQDSFNPDSFGLYTRLGFAVRDVAPYLTAEHLLPPPAPAQGLRALATTDIGELERYDHARTGADRRRDLALLALSGSALVHETGGSLDGYVFFRALPARVVVGPAVADSETTLGELVDGVAAALAGRAAVMRASSAVSVLRRCFDRGFRVDHLGNLMVAGTFKPPPAQLYALFPESL